MIYPHEPTRNKQVCKRCGNGGLILSNGYCGRCDDVIYGKQTRSGRSCIPVPIINPLCLKHKRLKYTQGNFNL